MNTTQPTHTEKATKYSHLEPTGELATRTSHRIYTHVALVDGVVATYHSSRELAEKKVASWVSRDTKFRTSDPERYRKYNPDGPSTFTVEAINFGTREEAPAPKAKTAGTWLNAAGEPATMPKPVALRHNPVIDSELYLEANGERPSGVGNWSFCLRLTDGTEVHEWFENLNYKTASKKATSWAVQTAGSRRKIARLYPRP